MFDLAHRYATEGMAAYAPLQESGVRGRTERGYTATKHQREVGTGYFDDRHASDPGRTLVATALTGSTEEEQFFSHGKRPELKVAT